MPSSFASHHVELDAAIVKELLEDVDLPADREVTVGIEMPPTDDRAEVVAALRASAGAWSDEAHPELRSREDAVRFVRGLRAGFDRGL